MPQDRTPLIIPRNTQILAHVLPQFHPIAENDEWWGKGFTEWTNVVRARPLFQGHYQPHLPADLGFYDLRLPETREMQAQLAREAGLTGFCYYHYWFGGRRLLERPVNQILESGKPDFPFCLCWANEPWSRNWDGQNDRVLMPQSYSTDDDRNHIRWLLDAFSDPRYIKVDGRPLFLVYRPSDLPDIHRTTDLWRSEAVSRGFPDLFLCSVRAFPGEFCDPRRLGMDASLEFKPNGTDCGPPLQHDDPIQVGYRLHRVWDYETLAERSLDEAVPNHPFFRSVCPGWDNSARRKHDAVIFRGATPDKYQHWLQEILYREHFRKQEPSFVFINAWNEWAEGNHLEPCQHWGHAYLDATRAAIAGARASIDGIRLHEGEVVTAVKDNIVRGSVDSVVRDAAGVDLNGWSIWTRDQTPASVLLFAEEIENGHFRLLRGRTCNGFSRPDVAAYVGSDSALRSGWTAHLATAQASVTGPLCLLAFDAKSRDFALLARLQPTT